jgi:hypothetical protein
MQILRELQIISADLILGEGRKTRYEWRGLDRAAFGQQPVDGIYILSGPPSPANASILAILPANAVGRAVRTDPVPRAGCRSMYGSWPFMLSVFLIYSNNP